MIQKYKVFIDNKSITLIKNNRKLNQKNWISFKSKSKIWNKIQNNKLNSLFIANKKPKNVWKNLFIDYKKIDAAGGLIVKGNKFLVIKRNGVWDLPKGKIEKNESKKDAAIREVEEETGIKSPTIIVKLHTTNHCYQIKNRNIIKKTAWYLMNYAGKEKLVAQKEEGIKKVKWVSKRKLKNIKKQTYPSIKEVIDSYLNL